MKTINIPAESIRNDDVFVSNIPGLTWAVECVVVRRDKVIVDVFGYDEPLTYSRSQRVDVMREVIA